MKVGSFKYDVLFQDHQKIEAERTEMNQSILMSANLFNPVEKGQQDSIAVDFYENDLAGATGPKGTDCPFYMMKSDESFPSNVALEDSGSCPSNNLCPEFLCDMDA